MARIAKKTAPPSSEAAKEKKAPAKKEREIPTTINLQAYGKSISGEELIEMAKQAWVDTGHELSAIKRLDIYIKTEDSRVYYVVNQTDTGTFFLYG